MAAKWQRPTVDTKFHIDTTWWTENHRDMRVYVREALCDECRDAYKSYENVGEIDAIDDVTGEVRRVDGLMHTLRTCCSLKPDYISPNTTVIDAIFRTFLANGNQPLSVNELYALLDRRPPATILRLLTAGTVYMGIRPVR
ncbi:MAG: hypothetical protein GX557_01900 [Chloroflexi bacterium]|nr:hypothetical protein [Chloroflexota bacterium]